MINFDSVKLVSFDVFDTLITRLVVKPVHVFVVMADKIDEQEEFNPLFVKFFRSLRVWSEFVTSRKLLTGKVSLQLIYEKMATIAKISQSQINYLINLELTTEQELLHPIPGAVELVERARQIHGRVVFMSDMYLPEPFLRELLTRYELLKEGDALYISGGLGISKGSGKLFDHVLRIEGLAPEELLHIGDHILSDYLVPLERGIGVLPEHFVVSTKGFCRELIATRHKLTYALELFKALCGLWRMRCSARFSA